MYDQQLPLEANTLTLEVSCSRLANQIFTFISWYGMSESLNRTPLVCGKDVEEVKRIVTIVNEDIRPLFPKLADMFYRCPAAIRNKMVYLEAETNCCTFDDPKRFGGIRDKHISVQGPFFQSFKYFDEFKGNIRKLVEPSGAVQKTIDNFLPASRNRDFLICTHTRRGDFVEYNWEHSTAQFTRLSTDYVVEKYRNRMGKKVSVFVAGDDIPWVRTVYNQSDINYEISYSSLDRYGDMAFAWQHCDVVIVTSARSTFGWWMGYLSKGGIVYYSDVPTGNISLSKQGIKKPEDYFPPYWNRIRLVDGVIVEVH